MFLAFPLLIVSIPAFCTSSKSDRGAYYYDDSKLDSKRIQEIREMYERVRANYAPESYADIYMPKKDDEDQMVDGYVLVPIEPKIPTPPLAFEVVLSDEDEITDREVIPEDRRRQRNEEKGDEEEKEDDNIER